MKFDPVSYPEPCVYDTFPALLRKHTKLKIS